MNRVRLSVVLTTALVAGVGLITLVGLLVSESFGTLGALISASPIRALTDVLLRLAAAVLALTVLLGAINLLGVNVNRVLRGRTFSARLGSTVLVGSFLTVILVRIIDGINQSSNTNVILERVQVPIGAALNSLLFFVLVWGAMRILRRGLTWGRLLFVLTVLVTLASLVLSTTDSASRQFSEWLLSVPVSAGASGVLLGVALATLVAGARVLIGQDRQYGE
ncbi:hypothetical protein VZO05_10275 [Aggregatilineales bacterium SYSU G02658]